MSFPLPLQPGWLSNRTLGRADRVHRNPPFLGGIYLRALKPGGTVAFPTEGGQLQLCCPPLPATSTLHLWELRIAHKDRSNISLPFLL